MGKKIKLKAGSFQNEVSKASNAAKDLSHAKTVTGVRANLDILTGFIEEYERAEKVNKSCESFFKSSTKQMSEAAKVMQETEKNLMS